MNFEYVIIASLAVAYLGLVVLAFKALDVLQKSTSFAKDRESTRLTQLVEKLVDKITNPVHNQFDVTQIHAQERQNEINANATIERDALEKKYRESPLVADNDYSEGNPFDALHG